MKWSLKLGRFAGVDMFVHWTFVILLAWVFVAYLGATRDVDSAMSVECHSAEADEPLERVFDRLRERKCSAVPVIDQGRLIGVLTFDNLSELMMVNSALARCEKSSSEIEQPELLRR